MSDAVVHLTLNSAKRRMSTRAAFFITGFAMGAWAPLVPYAQHRLDLDAGMLGMLLLCLGGGSLVTMLFSGKLAGRFGCRAMIVAGTVMIGISLPLLATVDSLSLMMFCLLLFGAGVGLIDVTVNIQGALIEQQSDVPLMSGFHGLFSIGGIVGAASGSLILSMGLSPFVMALCAVAVVFAVIVYAGKHLLPLATHQDEHNAPFRPDLPLVLMAGMCMVCFLAEGAMLDWSGVWLTSQRGLVIEHAGWGYAAFGCAMAMMRLAGDRIVNLSGRKNLLIFSGLFVMCGFAVAVFVQGWHASLSGFVLVGIGAANVAPVLTSLAARQKTTQANMSVAFVSTMGYLGILLGPVILGFITHLTSLSVAFLCVAASMFIVVFGGMTLRFK